MKKLGKFYKKLKYFPTPGSGGCSNHFLWLVALAAKKAKLSIDDAVRYIFEAIPTDGPKQISLDEVKKTVAKAYATNAPKGNSPLAKPRRETPDLVAFMEGFKNTSEKDLTTQSPVSVADPARNPILLLKNVFEKNEFVFIGTRYDGKENIKSRFDWCKRLQEIPLNDEVVELPLICPNPFTGAAALTASGTESWRCDNAVGKYRLAVVEFDDISRSEQISFWKSAIDKGFPVVALICSAGKSIHGWIAVNCSSSDEWNEQVKIRLFNDLFVPLGADKACNNFSRMSRFPGNYREKDGDYQMQRLLYLNPKALMVTDSAEVIIDKMMAATPMKSVVTDNIISATVSPHGKQDGEKPEILFSPSIPLSVTAQTAGAIFGTKSKTIFLQNSIVMKVLKVNGQFVINPVSAQKFRTEVESVANLKKVSQQGTQTIKVPMHMTNDMAKVILVADSFQCGVRPLKWISNCPLPYYKNGTMAIQTGYNPITQILANGEIEADIPPEEALELLYEVLKDFSLKTPGDLSRAIAYLITPMLELSGLLPGRSPLFFIEADDTQGGKGFLVKLVAALYGCNVETVTEKDKIGSKQESFDAALLNGATFLSFDNFRGNFDSQSIESFLTEDYYVCRIPYRAPVRIYTRGRNTSLTSNGAILTRDMRNRCCIVRIVKKPEDYVFANYPEGDILQHVRANQPKYLGAVYTIVKTYCGTQDQPLRKTTTTSHDFRGWAQSLDWIVQNIFGQAPLLDGHQAEKLRMSNSDSQWLRELCLAVLSTGRSEQLKASELADIAYKNGMTIPGLDGSDFGSATDDGRRQVFRQLGRRLSAAICVQNELLVDNMRIVRSEHQERDSLNKLRTVKKYQFFKPDIDTTVDVPQILPQTIPPQDTEDTDKTGKVLKDEICNDLGVTEPSITLDNLKVLETSVSSVSSVSSKEKFVPNIFGDE